MRTGDTFFLKRTFTPLSSILKIMASNIPILEEMVPKTRARHKLQGFFVCVHSKCPSQCRISIRSVATVARFILFGNMKGLGGKGYTCEKFAHPLFIIIISLNDSSQNISPFQGLFELKGYRRTFYNAKNLCRYSTRPFSSCISTADKLPDRNSKLSLKFVLLFCRNNTDAAKTSHFQEN